MVSASSRDCKLMNYAIKKAEDSEMYFRHGCVIAKGKRIISKGCNNYRNKFSNMFMPTTSCSCCCSCHAEMDALMRIASMRRRQQSQKHTRRKRPCVLSKGPYHVY